MKGIGIALIWFVIGAVTFFVALVHAGCGSATKPNSAKPEPRQTQDAPYVCLRVEREGKGEVVVCGTEQMCKHIHGRIVAFWEVLETRYSATGVSDCLPFRVTFQESPLSGP